MQQELPHFAKYTFKENTFFANTGIVRKRAHPFLCFLPDPTG
jgi:hypothetical protein